MENKEFEFKEVLEKGNQIKDLQKRLLFYKKHLKAFNQLEIGEQAFNQFDNQIKEEIKYLVEVIKSENSSINPTNLNKENSVDLIWWKHSARLLGYLMEELAKNDLIDRRSSLNKIIKDHFIDKNRKRFPKSIAQNRSGSGNNKGTSINKGSKPIGHNDVDTIIKNLKKKS